MKKYLSQKEVRAKHLKRVAQNNARYRLRNAGIVEAFRRDGCTFCVESDVACLEAHHLDPKQKDGNIARMVFFSEKRLRFELSKCICVCSNCHRKLHAGRILKPRR